MHKAQKKDWSNTWFIKDGIINTVLCPTIPGSSLKIYLTKAINGNTKNCINIAHWNGGNSHLGKSSKGKENLEDVKFLLNKHNEQL